MHEADVMMAYMAAPIIRTVPNDISLIVDIKHNMSGNIRHMIRLGEMQFRLNVSNKYWLFALAGRSPLNSGYVSRYLLDINNSLNIHDLLCLSHFLRWKVAGVFWCWSVNPGRFRFDIVMLISLVFSTNLSCLYYVWTRSPFSRHMSRRTSIPSSTTRFVSTLRYAPAQPHRPSPNKDSATLEQRPAVSPHYGWMWDGKCCAVHAGDADDNMCGSSDGWWRGC